MDMPNRVSTAGWRLDGLLAAGKNFQAVPRVSARLSADELNNAIEKHERDGVPLIIEGWHHVPAWPKILFTPEWLLEHGDKGKYAAAAFPSSTHATSR